MLTSALIAALAAGFLGSFHCALMCGPILAAGCGPRRAGALGYFGGRLVSYALAGAIFGQLGAHAAHRFSSTGFQQGVLLLVAALALGKGLKLLLARRRPELVSLGPTGGERRPWLDGLAALLPRRGLPLGLVTGALPCGMLASGWALAASTGHPLHGALVMATFSLATAPALLLGLVASLPALRRRWTPAWQGLCWCALAIWIGVRPLLEHVHGGH